MPPRHTVYLDHSATTPTDPRVVEAMMPYFTDVFGNASSIHQYGRSAEQAIENARASIAGILNCGPSEVVFTSGGSESDNLAVRGAAWSARQHERGRHLITTPMEHSAVGKTVSQLADFMGFEVTLLPVDSLGVVEREEFDAAIRPETTFASIIYVNNEVGTLQPLAQLGALARERGVLFHTDAVQGAGQLDLDVQALNVDMLSISAHKFYGPKGVGALYVRDGIDLMPSQSGGTHENNRRAGTHNTPLIVGMAKALELAYRERESRTAHFQAMRDRLIDGVLNRIPDSYLSGHPEQRLPSHASFLFDSVDAGTLLMHLDMQGIAASSGSACKVGNPEPSSILLALGIERELAKSALRLTVGLHTTAEDIDYTVDVLASAIEKVRKLKQVMK